MYDTIQHRPVGELSAGQLVRVRLGYAIRSVQILADPLPLALAYKGAEHTAVLITGTDVEAGPDEEHFVRFLAVPDQEIMVLAR